MIPLVKGDPRLGPSEPRWSGEGVNGVHLLFGDVALPVRLVGLGAPEDHEAMLGLRELGVFLLGAICWVTSLQGRLLGLALLAEGATDVAPHGSAILEEVLCLPPMEQAGGLERLLEVFWACASPVGLWPSSIVGHGHHLLPSALSVLGPPIIASLG